MGLPDLYPAQVGSPYTTLAAPYTTGEATMTVVDATKLPDAPNIVCLAGSASGEFRYSGKDGNTLLGVVKLPGTPNTTWPAGTYAFRGISAYDHASIVEHLTYQRSHIVEASLDLTTNHTYSGRVLEGAEAGENLAFGDLAVLAESGKFVRANPVTLATLDGTIALVVSDTIAAGSQGMFLLRGLIRNDSWTFSQGKELYAGAGTLTHEPPTTGTQIIRKVGTALTATIIEFNPSSTLHAEYLVSVLPVNTVTKDNSDIERKFWKDDFSVDSEELYTVNGNWTGWGSGELTNVYWSGLTSLRTTTPTVGTRIGVLIKPITYGDGTEYFGFGFKNVDVASSIGVMIWSYNSTTVRIMTMGYSGATVSTTVETGLGDLYGQYCYVEIEVLSANTYDIYVNGTKYGSTVTETGVNLLQPISVGIMTSGGIGLTRYLKGRWVLPSKSYEDNFSSDTVTDGRYQAVTGTVAYDDVNKRMIITAGAGVTAKTRLKSYTQLEGAYKRKLHLPATGTDGDVVAAYFGTDPTLESGFGIGAIRTAGAWNIATIDGATVTDTGTVIADLVDGDSFYVEVERDTTHGVVWYYVYKSGKPTTASGKLFNTYQEIYDGFWFKNKGAAENSITVSEIEDRAESIVGRTNIEVTEPFWFRDEFSEDDSGRWRGHPSIWQIQNGRLEANYTSGTYGTQRILDINSDFASFEFDYTPVTETAGYYNGAGLAFCADGVSTSTGEATRLDKLTGFSGYVLKLYGLSNSRYVSIQKRGINPNTLTGISRADGVFTLGNTYHIVVTKDNNTGQIIVYVDGTPVIDVVDSDVIRTGKLVFGQASYALNDGGYISYFDNLQISGTRIYNKPIHRGAMLESYWDGTQEVVATAYLNDFNWDTGDITTDLTTGGTWAIDTTEGVLKVSTGASSRTGCSIRNVKIIDGYWRFRFNTSTRFQFGILQQTPITTSDSSSSIHNGGGYILHLHGENVYLHTSTTTHLGTAALTLTYNANYLCEFIKIGNRFTLYLTDSNGIVQTVTWTDPDNLFTTSLGVCNFFQHYPTSTTKIWDFVAIGIEQDSTNGIAACIPPVGGGARYGVEESVYIPITPGTEIPVGSAVISPNAKSTVVGTALTTFAQTPAGASASLEYATGTKTCPSLSTAFAPTGRHRVKADRNTPTNIGVKGSVAGTSPTVYIDSLHVRKQEVA